MTLNLLWPSGRCNLHYLRQDMSGILVVHTAQLMNPELLMRPNLGWKIMPGEIMNNWILILEWQIEEGLNENE